MQMILWLERHHHWSSREDEVTSFPVNSWPTSGSPNFKPKMQEQVLSRDILLSPQLHELQVLSTASFPACLKSLFHSTTCLCPPTGSQQASWPETLRVPMLFWHCSQLARQAWEKMNPRQQHTHFPVANTTTIKPTSQGARELIT